MILSRTYASRKEIPRGAEALYVPTGSLFVLIGSHDVGRAKRDFIADNPWDADNWNLTAQGRFIAEHGIRFAEAFAKAAGSHIGATKPRAAVYQPSLKVLIQKRDVTTNIYQTGGGAGADGLVAGLVTKT